MQSNSDASIVGDPLLSAVLDLEPSLLDVM
jgi:hypothetical protein